MRNAGGLFHREHHLGHNAVSVFFHHLFLAVGDLSIDNQGGVKGTHIVVGVLDDEGTTAGRGVLAGGFLAVGELALRKLVAVLIGGLQQEAVLFLHKYRAHRAPVRGDSQLGITVDGFHHQADDMWELAVGGDGSVGGVLQLGVIQAETGAAALTLQAGQGLILVTYIDVVDRAAATPSTESAHCGHILLQQGVFERQASVGLEGAIPDQALVPQHIEELRSLAEGLVGGGEGNLAVLVHIQVIGVVVAAAIGIGLAKAGGEAVEQVVRTEGVVGSKLQCQRILVLHAVSVQVTSIAESLQGFYPFVNRGRHIQANLLQPIGVDLKGAGGQHHSRHLFNVGEAVYMAVWRCGNFAVFGLTLQQSLILRHIVVDDVLGGEELALVRILGDKVAGLAVHKVPEAVRQLVTAGGQGQVDLLGDAVVGHILPLKTDTGKLLPLLDHLQLGNAPGTASGVVDKHTDLPILFFKGIGVGDDGHGAVQVD